jgi:hypothetical protein
MVHLQITLLSVVLVVAASVLHYEVLLRVSALIPALTIPPRRRTLVVVAAVMLAHMLQIGLYGAGYWGAIHLLGLGALTGTLEGNGFDYFYFSATTFTTLGVGDLTLEGPLRILAGIQSLNGLVLITWSASFTYISMEKFWLDQR